MATINVRQKGASGEREIATDLNYIIYKLMGELGCESPTMSSVQRNQNQSAVGGADLTGTLGFCIEIKRQEQLSVNTWWNQCCAASRQSGGMPVLIYRQNKQKWRCVMMGQLPTPDGRTYLPARCEVDYDTFKVLFEAHARKYLEGGGIIVV